MNKIKIFLIYLVSCFLIYFPIYIGENFGEVSLDQLFFHLSFVNIGEADQDIIWSIIKNCIIIPVICSIVLSGIQISYMKKSRFYLYFLGFTVFYFCWNLSVISYFRLKLNNEESDYITSNYVSPKNVKIVCSANNLKNLILIYVESLENIYDDAHLFGKNLIKKVEDLPGISFDKYLQVPGTEWTTAAMIATQCGMPVRVVALFSRDNNLPAGYAPELDCLGNILSDNGYHNIFMGGASLGFGRKGKFLTKHGYTENYGKEEWFQKGVPLRKMNEWGVYDDFLFKEAKKKLKELQATNKLFNLTILTVELHYPSGYYSDTCKEKFDAYDYEDLIECASDQVSDFVKYAIDQGVLENTNIVVIGDHLAPISLTKQKLPNKDTRTIFNKFISKDEYIKNREDIIHFDLFPTILEFIGFDVKGGRLGLGYSGFFKNNMSPNPNRVNEFRQKLLPKEDRYYEFLKIIEPGNPEVTN